MSMSRRVALRTTESPDLFDHFFEALDLQRVGEGAHQWVVHVLGLHTDGRNLWIQVAPDSHGADSLVVRTAAGTSASQILDALSEISPESTDCCPCVVSVTAESN